MKKMALIGLLVAVLALAACGPGEGPQDPRPRVLIIGDSISLGYTPEVAALLGDRAQVVHCPGNARHSWYGVVWRDKLVSGGPWDVIQFNWGLWDMCYRRPVRGGASVPDKACGRVTIGLVEYRRNLEQVVARLERTGATLVWASTTSVPAGERGRFSADVDRYNAVAAEIMRAHGIRITDLCAVSRAMPQNLRVNPHNVHFTAEGYRRLARAVVSGLPLAKTADLP
ncbi:SGNH/GDSL hydrolase family protein [bacterium CG_4_9_14_3_um_filter_65_15]|nr:MAG: SGNH/GDSL hydrolase family protein [bacterium CG_4_9_14_3_um_filter_65_15]